MNKLTDIFNKKKTNNDTPPDQQFGFQACDTVGRSAAPSRAPFGFDGVKLDNEKRFNEFVEKSKSNEGVKRNIVKNPKKLRESFSKIVKESHVQNFIASQDYAAIKKRFSNTNRFTDTEFKACQASLYFSGTFQQNLLRTSSGIVWKRAKDLVNEAHFAVDEKGAYADPRHIKKSNYKRFYQTTDLDQGALGNCWFIAAAAGIIQNYDLFRKVVPFDNSLENNEYTGAFRFRFWLFGEWKEVVVGKLIS
jgi:hypothetical protein